MITSSYWWLYLNSGQTLWRVVVLKIILWYIFPRSPCLLHNSLIYLLYYWLFDLALVPRLCRLILTIRSIAHLIDIQWGIKRCVVLVLLYDKISLVCSGGEFRLCCIHLVMRLVLYIKFLGCAHHKFLLFERIRCRIIDPKLPVDNFFYLRRLKDLLFILLPVCRQMMIFF